MDANTYQAAAARTLIPEGEVPEFAAQDLQVALATLRLLAASAQCAEIVKKGVFHQHGLDRRALVEAMWELKDAGEDFGTAVRDTVLDRLPSDTGPTPLPPAALRLVWNALGLAGEGGEVASLILGEVEQAGPRDLPALIKELGDVAWYLVTLCTVLGIDFRAVLEVNDAKLRDRYPNGWEPALSHHSAEGDR